MAGVAVHVVLAFGEECHHGASDGSYGADRLLHRSRAIGGRLDTVPDGDAVRSDRLLVLPDGSGLTVSPRRFCAYARCVWGRFTERCDVVTEAAEPARGVVHYVGDRSKSDPAIRAVGLL